MVKQQQQEVEKAIIGYSQYQLQPQFSSLAVTEEKWFRMTQEQRQRYIRKFNVATVQHMNSEDRNTATPMPTSDTTSNSAGISSLSECSSSANHDITVGRLGITSMCLSVLLDEAVNKIKLPYTTMEEYGRKLLI